MSRYGPKFYESHMEGSACAAAKVVPIVLELLPVKSVCDVGCGVGTWLGAFEDFGVSEFLGLDGQYVPLEMLKIPVTRFRPMDLSTPFRLDQKFDLAVCVEVAEHLPAARAESFVEDLTQLAPTILFSAAIPGQGGISHINEQWPSWWARIFERHGFAVCDLIRPKIWDDSSITPCYRQNVLLFVTQDRMHSNRLLTAARPGQLDLVHPAFYSRMVRTDDLKMLVKHLWWAINTNWQRSRRTDGS